MKEMVERCLVTVGKDENQTGMVVFPYNEEDVLERFGVETTKELKFVDHPESKVSVAQFNYIIGESENGKVHRILFHWAMRMPLYGIGA